MYTRTRFTDDKLNSIFDRTGGFCHLCWGRLAFSNYGEHGARGAWHVEHSNPVALGGTDRMNNLFAGCIHCNLRKGTLSTHTIRRRSGITRAPYSPQRVADIALSNTICGTAVGATIGGLLGGKQGALCGAIIGAAIAYASSEDR